MCILMLFKLYVSNRLEVVFNKQLRLYKLKIQPHILTMYFEPQLLLNEPHVTIQTELQPIYTNRHLEPQPL